MSMNERAQLAALIRERRDALGLTQGQLADRAGTTRQTISNVETAATVPQQAILLRITEVLGISPQSNSLDADVEAWVGVIGGMLQALPSASRNRAGQAAVNAVAAEIGRPNVSALTEDDIHVTPEGPKKGYALAARRGTKKANQPHAE